MAKLVIKGHATRGKEVIETLEMLGGKNAFGHNGDDPLSVYYVDNSYRDYIICYYVYEDCDCVIFTLEEFLEKFPYKVGDKVQHKGATSCGSVFEVEEMYWEDEKVKYIIRYLGGNYDGVSTVTAEDLQPYKEETIEGKNTMNEDKGTLVAIDLTREFRKADDIEVILGDYEFVLKDGKTYFVKKNKYPKTYEECCKTLHIPVNGDIVYAGNWADGGEYLDKHLDIIRNFQKLRIYRDAYWKIAGEQMGLGKPWEPEFRFGKKKYCIMNKDNKVIKATVEETNRFLVFPTEKMIDEFYENFKNLIEQCKELL